jgi:hypothetical protein
MPSSRRRRVATPGAVAWLLALFTMAGPAASAAAESHTDVQIAVEVSRAADGAGGRLSMLVVPLVLRHRQGPWTFQVEAPLVRIDSVESVVPGIGSIDARPSGTGAASTRQRDAGLGDVWFKLSRELRIAGPGMTGVDLTVKLKAATGDVDRGLGSGGTDVALQLEGLHAVGAFTWFGHVGYRRTGDLAGYAPYRDPWYGEVGSLYRASSTCEHGLLYSHRQAIGRLGALGETTAFSACRFGAQRVQLYLTRGLQPASPQWALGLLVRQRF